MSDAPAKAAPSDPAPRSGADPVRVAWIAAAVGVFGGGAVLHFGLQILPMRSGLAALWITTLVLFAADKLAATRGWKRVPERVLLTLAAVGGSPVIAVARPLLRHKTVKASFGYRFDHVIAAQLVVLAGLAWIWLGPA